MKKGKII